MVWVIAFGELFFGDLWCVVWGYGGMRTHFSLLNPQYPRFPHVFRRMRISLLLITQKSYPQKPV